MWTLGWCPCGVIATATQARPATAGRDRETRRRRAAFPSGYLATSSDASSDTSDARRADRDQVPLPGHPEAEVADAPRPAALLQVDVPRRCVADAPVRTADRKSATTIGSEDASIESEAVSVESEAASLEPEAARAASPTEVWH